MTKEGNMLHPLKSKTIWGLVLAAPAVIAEILRAIGRPDLAMAVDTFGGILHKSTGDPQALSGILAAPGIGMATYGRWTAEEPLSISAPLTNSDARG
jgi:hypothetical protein